MTTIAANLKCMASDSRVTVEHKGIDYPAVKILKKGNSLIGAAGHGGDCTRFIHWAAGKFSDKEPKWAEEEGQEDSVIGLILNRDGIFLWTQGDPEPEKIEAEYYAVGSGGTAARVALKLGKTPAEAVALACEVDMYSGLPVQVLEL